MVFVAGPRQVGKSTLARQMLGRRVNALREDLQVSHKTVSSWVAIRAVKKEQKHYHLDWAVVAGDAARFENLVAAHLLKWVHHQQDTLGREVELRYFRDVDGREEIAATGLAVALDGHRRVLRE